METSKQIAIKKDNILVKQSASMATSRRFKSRTFAFYFDFEREAALDQF